MWVKNPLLAWVKHNPTQFKPNINNKLYFKLAINPTHHVSYYIQKPKFYNSN